MAWAVEVTDELAAWFSGLDESERESVAGSLGLLEEYGVRLGFPHTSGVQGSRHGHMRELRIQHEGRPYRLLYAFDPRRTAIVLLGGDKTGDNRWYEVNVPKADALYDQVLDELREEGLV